jgi:hypothetical protein
MRDPCYLFDISAATEILRDTPENSAFEPTILSFLPLFIYLLGNLGPAGPLGGSAEARVMRDLDQNS